MSWFFGKAGPSTAVVCRLLPALSPARTAGTTTPPPPLSGLASSFGGRGLDTRRARRSVDRLIGATCASMASFAAACTTCGRAAPQGCVDRHSRPSVTMPCCRVPARAFPYVIPVLGRGHEGNKFMRFYAECPARVVGQIVLDLLAVTWLAAWIWIALQLRGAVLRLQDPGRQLVDAGQALQGTFGHSAQAASGLPFVGADLARAVNQGTRAGQVVTEAGNDQILAIGYIAAGVAGAVIVLAAVPLLWYWLPRRVRYARAAAAAAAMRNDDPELLALRALMERSHRQLRSVSKTPAHAWRTGDAEVIPRLASLQLATLGLRTKSPHHAQRPGL